MLFQHIEYNMVCSMCGSNLLQPTTTHQLEYKGTSNYSYKNKRGPTTIWAYPKRPSLNPYNQSMDTLHNIIEYLLQGVPTSTLNKFPRHIYYSQQIHLINKTPRTYRPTFNLSGTHSYPASQQGRTVGRWKLDLTTPNTIQQLLIQSTTTLL